MSTDVRLRLSVLGLFVKSEGAFSKNVLMIHKMTGPEPDRWDLPGGGVQPGEPVMQALAREIAEETGLTQVRIEGLLTIVEDFFPHWRGQLLHSLSLIYRCSVAEASVLSAADGEEVGAKGVQWVPLAALTPENCSSRCWQALQFLGGLT